MKIALAYVQEKYEKHTNQVNFFSLQEKVISNHAHKKYVEKIELFSYSFK